MDALRQERVLSTGHDHTCRVWKVPEESQLIYRAPGMAVDCCRYQKEFTEMVDRVWLYVLEPGCCHKQPACRLFASGYRYSFGSDLWNDGSMQYAGT